MRNKHKSTQVSMNVTRDLNSMNQRQPKCDVKERHTQTWSHHPGLPKKLSIIQCSRINSKTLKVCQDPTMIWSLHHLLSSSPLLSASNPIGLPSFSLPTFACIDLPIPYRLYITDSFSSTRSHHKLTISSGKPSLTSLHSQAIQIPLLYISETYILFFHKTCLSLYSIHSRKWLLD